MTSSKVNLTKCACFGVAGNFTGHLEQAGEAVDFTAIKTVEANAPKALFPTYIPNAGGNTPAFLKIFPFNSRKIIFPENEQKIQIEPECAVVFKAEWNEGRVSFLTPLYFGASNDVSIRKEGAKKISIKKNWGKCSKGLSSYLIPLDSFTEKGILNRYRIASFMVRDNQVFPYGEDSAVRDYSYIYEKLTDWLIEKLNNQKDEGPAEDINSYLTQSCCPHTLMISIGATRYTDFGEHNFLQKKDKSVVVLYPEDKYSSEEIVQMVKENKLNKKDISALVQDVVL